MFFGMSYYQVAWYFVVYSILGWVIEVIYHAVVKGEVINRGFLNGPVCPIYGFGVVSVFSLVGVLGQESGGTVESLPLWELFLFGVVLATLVELIGGWLLDKLFHARWWDYSDKPFNLHGYICLEFSLIWGLCITFVVREMQPYIRSASHEMIPESIGWPILLIIYLLYAADLVITVLSIHKLNHALADLDQIRKSMRSVSDEMSNVIGGGTLKTMELLSEEKAKATEARESLMTNLNEAKESLKDNMEEALSRRAEHRALMTERSKALRVHLQNTRFFGSGRLVRAFPEMQHHDYNDLLKELRASLSKRIQKE